MSEDCPFCRIAERRLKAHVVYEDDRLVAFLDRGPIRPGHTQIMAKAHFPYFDEAPTDLVAAIVALGQRLATAMKRLYGVPRVAFLFSGGDIAHVHAHVVPMHEKTDITSRRYIVEDAITFRDMPRASDSELADTASKLSSLLAPSRTAIER
jgi:histidine triad (HIT) family protein